MLYLDRARCTASLVGSMTDCPLPAAFLAKQNPMTHRLPPAETVPSRGRMGGLRTKGEKINGTSAHSKKTARDTRAHRGHDPPSENSPSSPPTRRAQTPTGLGSTTSRRLHLRKNRRGLEEISKEGAAEYSPSASTIRASRRKINCACVKDRS